MIVRKLQKSSAYFPHQGYIGHKELKVPNYLFTARNSESRGYDHCQDLAKFILQRSVQEQYRNSKALTDFLRKRELTFSKLTPSGEYKIFSVPCTTTPLPVPKSLFNALEKSAQVLIGSLRLVLQDIYSAENVRASRFVQSLPRDLRRQFVRAVEECPQYFPQLHHPVMKDYPFFDVVGLDLVLTEDYANFNRGLHVAGEKSKIPFRLLEINAGSPSGASNNQHLLDGMAKIDPAMLEKIGKVMPNDHFKVLSDAYRSLGETWTGRTDGVQILLPPGGESGAAPEIHQLAANSGLVYADAGQLYKDADGNIRLRTVSGKDPVVTAIYSRVNADSALYDRKKGLHLRDAENGKPLFWVDPIKSVQKLKTTFLRNPEGEIIPLESNYAIPDAVEAIHNRKLYLGGLNRVLDNKIILSALCDYAPKFFRAELEAIGIDTAVDPVSPPETLPSTRDSVKIIAKNPEDWVIKSPNLSGGKGVYILKTLSPAEQKKVIKQALRNPTHYAYQKLVRIGRLPVASKGRNGEARFANLAADLRMWMFFGAGEKFKTPRLTHNALIRMAPHEKGPLSSIVNTSMGGGYAPMVVADDTNHPDAVTIDKLVAPRLPAPLPCDLPTFVGAQLVQVAQLASSAKNLMREGDKADVYQTYLLISNLKKQCREILSYLHPRNMEPVNEILEILERKVDKKRISKFYSNRNWARIQLTTQLERLETKLDAKFFQRLDDFRALNKEPHEYDVLDTEHDKVVLASIKKILEDGNAPARDKKILIKALQLLVKMHYPKKQLVAQNRHLLHSLLDQFCAFSAEHLANSRHDKGFVALFSRNSEFPEIDYKILFAQPSGSQVFDENNPHALIATEEELHTGQLLIDSNFIPTELRAARSDWMNLMGEAAKLPEAKRAAFVEEARKNHFQKYPSLREYQALIDNQEEQSLDAMIKLLDVLPYAKYNIAQYAKQQNLYIDELFKDKLMDRRIAILSKEERKKNGLSHGSFAGECFARKRHAHGLFSDSQVYLWIAKELNPLIQAYTVGHELIHYHQIRSMMDLEQKALKEGPAQFARFLHFFGNFLGLAAEKLEDDPSGLAPDRLPVYGFAELQTFQWGKNWVAQFGQALLRGTRAWEKQIRRFGSLVGYSTDVASPARVKAIREVIPALENAKNIRFAKDLGLILPLDEVQSSLPTANKAQRERYQETINKAVYSPRLNWETLRVIANHQYSGLRFPRREVAEDNLTLKSPLQTIALGGSYNQTQQQQ